MIEVMKIPIERSNFFAIYRQLEIPIDVLSMYPMLKSQSATGTFS